MTIEFRNLYHKLVLFVLFFSAFRSQATLIEDTVYINRGLMMTVDSVYIPYLAFNPSATFEVENKRLFLNANDSIALTIINTDSITHGFDIKYYNGIATTIPAFGSANVQFGFSNAGAHIYYDPTNAEAYRYMGLGGMIVVKDPTTGAQRFFWNMKEHQSSYNLALDQGISVDWNEYYPDYFTINGRSNPWINSDTNARVVGSVGDTLLIYMVNTGQSLHSLHFHGYHLSIEQSSKFPNHVGRSKDTFAVHSMEVVVLELIPNQVGEYPVHDHNLVAVSGGNLYPNGMFLTLLID